MHYASKRAPVLSFRATAAAELEMVIDGIYKCHYCWHCVGTWLRDCFSVVMMVIFPSVLLLQTMHSNACFFRCGNQNQDVYGNICYTDNSFSSTDSIGVWFCFLSCQATWLPCLTWRLSPRLFNLLPWPWWRERLGCSRVSLSHCS